jgi:hypothetical protein
MLERLTHEEENQARILAALIKALDPELAFIPYRPGWLGRAWSWTGWDGNMLGLLAGKVLERTFLAALHPCHVHPVLGPVISEALRTTDRHLEVLRRHIPGEHPGRELSRMNKCLVGMAALFMFFDHAHLLHQSGTTASVFVRECWHAFSRAMKRLGPGEDAGNMPGYLASLPQSGQV